MFGMSTSHHSRSDIIGLLGTMVAVCITPVLAVLLVGGGGHRPLLETRDVLWDIP